MHIDPQARPRTAGEEGISILSVLLALLAVIALFLFTDSSLRDLGALAADAGESVAGAVGGGAQARAMRAMQAIGEANSRMRIEHGRYAESLQELHRMGYGGFSYAADPWGHPWSYQGSSTSWRLTSLGADGKPGPPAPADWRSGHEASDLVMTSGTFVQAPRR